MRLLKVSNRVIVSTLIFHLTMTIFIPWTLERFIIIPTVKICLRFEQ